MKIVNRVHFPLSWSTRRPWVRGQTTDQTKLIATTAESPAVLPVIPTNYLPLSWQLETNPTLLQHNERILNSCALFIIYSCNFNHTFMYRLDWWKNKLLLLLLLLLLLWVRSLNIYQGLNWLYFFLTWSTRRPWVRLALRPGSAQKKNMSSGLVWLLAYMTYSYGQCKHSWKPCKMKHVTESIMSELSNF